MLVQRLLLRSVRLKTRLLAGIQYASSRSCDRKTPSSFFVVYLGLTVDNELLGKLHTELRSYDTTPSILTSSFLRSQNSRFKIETKLSNYFLCCTFQCGLLAQWLQPLAMGWAVQGSDPGETEFFCFRPDHPWGPLSLLNNWCRTILGGKRPWR